MVHMGYKKYDFWTTQHSKSRWIEATQQIKTKCLLSNFHPILGLVNPIFTFLYAINKIRSTPKHKTDYFYFYITKNNNNYI